MSDLHFGRADPGVVAAVQEIARRLEPHLIVVSGDLSQRARTHEFMAARVFLNSLATPVLVVPGNHDVPLYNVAARFLQPLRQYKKHVADEVQPVFEDHEITVVGINTSRSLTWKGGRINRDQVQRARDIFCSAGRKRVRFLVSHHPFELPLQTNSSALVGRAAMAMEGWRDCPPDVFLSGHLHVHHASASAIRNKESGASILVQAGTTTSTRSRGEQNSFNLLHVRMEHVEVERYDWIALRSNFALGSTIQFARMATGWQVTNA